MSTSSDPFTKAYDGLWNLLEAHSGFTGLVKLANRIKFSGDGRTPWKGEVGPGDLPEVALLPSDLTFTPESDSSATTVSAFYDVLLSTGDQIATDAAVGLYPVLWEILRALSGWRSMREAVTWNARKYVLWVLGASAAPGLTDPEKNRKIKGWTAVCRIEVRMCFTTADMAPTEE